MIASVRGTVLAVRLDAVVIEVGGVGLLVAVTPATAAALHVGREASLATTLVVREESLTLFGFADDDARQVFETVQTVSGIGPRLALAMLTVLDPDDLRRAVAAQDTAALRKVPGIGLKGAQRILLELGGRLGDPGGPPATGIGGGAATGTSASARATQVEAALVGLGWSQKQAEDAVGLVGDLPTTAEMLRAALRRLGRA